MTKLKIYLKNLAKLALVNSLFFSLISCSSPEKPFTRTDFKKEVISAFKQNNRIKAVTKFAGDTVYIYLPVTENLIRTQRVKKTGRKEKETKLAYVDSSYENETFTIKYATRDFPKPKSFFRNISFNFTDYANNLMRKSFFLLRRARTDSTEEFSFYVLYIANIKNGIEIKETIHEEDFKKSSIGVLPSFEFNKRIILEVIGNKEIVGDEKGKHIDYQDITMPYFINELLIYTLQRGGFPLGKEESTEKTIINTFHRITESYDFKDYQFVVLKNVLTGEEKVIFPAEIEEILASNQDRSRKLY